MKEKMQVISKKSLSMFLALIMIVTILPYNTITAEAASATADSIISIARGQKGSYGSDINKFTTWYYGKKNSQPWCAIFVMWCANQAGVYKKAVPNAPGCSGMKDWFFKRGEYYSISSSYIPQKGDIVFFSNGKSSYSHVEFVSETGYITENGKKKVKCVGGNTSNSNFSGSDYVSEKKRYVNESSLKIVGYAHPNYGSSINYKITGNDVPSSRTNTTNSITASLNTTANVQSWGYYVGTSESDVKAHKNTKGSEKSQFITVQAYTKSGQSLKTLSTTVKNLKPNKKYYYITAVKIGDKWYHSNCYYGLTTNIIPNSATLRIDDASADIGISDTSTVTWNDAKGADSYTIKLYDSNNKEVYSKTGISGTSFVFPANCFAKTGTFKAKLWAVNAAGSTEAWGNPVITVHKNVNVTFYDTVTKTNIITQSVTYGHDAIMQTNPQQTGYKFEGWDKEFKNVKEDIVVNTVYTPNKYTVKFVDGYNNKSISDNKKYEFNSTITAKDYPDAPSHKNYKFVGWSEEDYTVKAETHTIYARYEWDLPTDIGTEIVSIERAKSDMSETVNDGYNVNVEIVVPAGTTKTIKGRVVVALKTANGRLLIETESSAFVLYPSTTEERIKQIEVFVPYEAKEEDLAAVTEVYVVNDYNSAGIISNVAKDSVKTSASNADEWQFSTVRPVIGQNGVVDTDSNLDYVTYDLITTTTKESLATSLNGYNFVSSRWSGVVDSGSVRYVKNWPRLGNTAGQASKGTAGSQFNNSTSTGSLMYSWFNNADKVKSNSETATTKTTVSEHQHANIYYHWCCNRNNGTLTHNVTDSKWYADNTTKNKYYTFHMNYLTLADGALPTTYDKNNKKTFYVRDLSKKDPIDVRDKCTDSKYWTSALPVYQQDYQIQRKIYTYNKTDIQKDIKVSSVSQIPGYTKTALEPVIDSNVTLNTTVETNTSNKQQWYAYKTKVNVSHTDKNKYNLVAAMGKEYAGKEVTVYVYKDTQVSDFTTEFISTAMVNSDGKIVINDAQLREKCTENTGDFTIAVALPGETNAMVVGKIEAPKPIYTVTYYDYDGETVVLQKTVEEGGTVTAPSSDKLHIPVGHRFTGWDLSTVGVNSDLSVKPMSETETYTVTFIQWASKQYETQEIKYGEEIAKYIPEIIAVDGIVSEWDLSSCEKIKKTAQGIEYETEIVTGNLVITTKEKTKINTVTFIDPESDLMLNGDVENKDIDEIVILDNDIVNEENTEYGDRIDTPVEIEESPDYIFLGWKNIETGNYLEDTTTVEDGIYVPEYTFAETVDIPEASVKTGEYTSNQTVELTCTTDKAVIYYTTDGTNPETSKTAIEYTKPITLTKSCNLQFCAMALGMNNSGVVSELYAINTSSSGKSYHIVTVYTDLPQSEGEYYQALIKDSTLFKDDDLQNIEGYTYNGLFVDESHGEPFFSDSEVVTSSMNLYAGYTPFVYTATFVDEDGTLIAKVDTNYGDSAVEPAKPEKSGYVFIGWDSDDYLCMTKNGTFTAQYVPEDEYANVEFTIKASRECMAGSALKLSRYIKITPADMSDTPLIWTSSNSDVADVDENGVVSMLKPGTATITVMVESSGEEAKFAITVTPNSEMQITLAKNSILGFDSDRNVREIPDGKNTVAELRDEFMNDELHFYGVNGNELLDADRVGTGAVIKLLDGDKVLDEVTVIMTGDFNGDGSINSRDVSMLMQHTVDLREINQYQEIALDVNGDGKVNNRDSAILSAYLVGKADMV